MITGMIVGLFAGLIALGLKAYFRRRNIRRQAMSDAGAIGARMQEVLAWYAQRNPEEWPPTVPPQLEGHLHVWSPQGDCLCGAHLDGGVIYTFTRGQLLKIAGEWHRVVMLNVMGCGHWVLDGFPDLGDEIGDCRHFTTEELLRSLHGEEVNVDD